MMYVVAIDVGGTSMKGGLVGRSGRVTAADSRPTTGTGTGAVETIRAFATDLVELGHSLHGQAPQAVGIAVPGLVEGGVARYSANLGWRDVPARDFCDLDLPVRLANDVRAAGLAEARHLRESDFLFLPIGTSIAGAIFLNGEMYGDSLSGQIGHVPVWPNGRACPCGQKGCLAAYASASAVAARYGAAGAAEVAEAVAKGDPQAMQVWDSAVEALALALTSYTLTLDPKKIVIGGGLAESGELLLQPLRERLADALAFRRPPPVLASRLGMRAGVLGAALLAWDAWQERGGGTGSGAPPAGTSAPAASTS